MAGGEKFGFSRFSEKRSYQSSDVSGYDDYVEGVEAEETASLDLPITKENVGFKLIEKMGWQSGTGLGKDKQGRVEPVPFELKDDYLGLGRWTLELELAQDATEKRKQLEIEKELTPDLVEKYMVQAEKERKMAETITEMRKSFYCELCDKQYTKYSEWDNHINSYSHHHNQRLRDLKEYETGRKFGGHRNVEEEREKMMAAQLIAIERARMAAKRAHGWFAPAFKPIGEASGGQSSSPSLYQPTSSSRSLGKRPQEDSESSKKIAEKKARIAKYGLRFHSAGMLMTVSDGGLKMISSAGVKYKPPGVPAANEEEEKHEGDREGGENENGAVCEVESQPSSSKRFKPWIQGETLEPDAGGEVKEPLSLTRKKGQSARDIESDRNSEQASRKLSFGFSKNSFLPAGTKLPLPPPTAPTTANATPPPLLSRSKWLAKAFAEKEEEEEGFSLARLHVKRTTKFKFNIKK